MEKVCEFCLALRPVVYCQADVAHLCLPCDARVHSANALSHRHLRTLLCYSCRCSPAYTHCLDHKMYVCHICDRRLHNSPSQHRKRILNSYTGCPSANELATMWNVYSSGLSGTARSDALISSASDSVNIGSATSVSSVSSFAYQQSTKVSQKGRQQQSSCLVLQQIVDLRRLQSGERNHRLNILRDQEKKVFSKSCLTREDTGPDMPTHPDLSTERDGCGETCPPPFSQLENLPLSSTAVAPLPGETFWQLRSPQNNQLWSQNLEDISLREEFFHGTDLDIPDIDMTFHNFEEAFRGEEDLMREPLEEVTSCSFANIDTSAATSDDGHANAASRDALVLRGDASSSQDKMDWGNREVFHSLSPSYVMMSKSLSRMSSKSVSNDFSVDSEPLPSNAEGGRLSDDTEADHRRHEKRTQTGPRQGRTAARKRIKGTSSKLEGYNSDNASIARSY